MEDERENENNRMLTLLPVILAWSFVFKVRSFFSFPNSLRSLDEAPTNAAFRTGRSLIGDARRDSATSTYSSNKVKKLKIIKI